MAIKSVVPHPKDSFSCLALVKKGSALANEWNLGMLTYCIYEYDKSTNSHEIRWGDGSWQSLDVRHYEDLVLITELDESTFDEIIPA